VSGAPLLEVERLTKRFGGLVANQDVTFTVGEGEVVGLIGPNGAGKTTLFNALAGYFAPTSGRIRFAGEDVAGLEPEAMAARGVARTFQIVRVFRSMTVLENVAVGAMLREKRVRAAERVARDMLDFVGMERGGHTLASMLTVAEQKRLEVARALATSPRLLLLDEVMAGLTGAEVQAAVDLVRRIQARGIACVIVEHVMEGIMPVADRLVVLERGRVLADGAPGAVARDPAVVAAYLGEGFHVDGP
jgi:branched-chain amino acid transport system ATP-binding protein